MKKKKNKGLFIIFMWLLFTTIKVYAQNNIYNIDIDVYIDKEANAQITEKWHVKGSDGTEWYKVLRDLGNSSLSNYTVEMDGKMLAQKNWNINETLEQKKGYYGINYNGNDTELCFGKYDYNEHTFTLKYNLSNYIFNTSDTQVLYWTYISKLQNVNFQNMSVQIRSYYDFPDNLDVWGYGYKGYAYVQNGVISLLNEENSNMNNKYVVALVKFPINTFHTENTVSYFNTFEDVLNVAEKGTFSYDYSNYYNSYNQNYGYDIIGRISTYITFFIFIFIGGFVTKKIISTGYGYKDNKTINKKSIHFFRDIPCNKDIYYANTLIYLNNFEYKEANILGAIILKWIREKKIHFIKKNGNSALDLTLSPTFNNKNEQELFSIMKTASKDGILEPKEFQKWAKNHYSKFFNIFKSFNDNEIERLKKENHIYPRQSKEECKKKFVMDDEIFNESQKLYGLKKFLKEFSSINTKETLEVHLWDEYLMFAYLFGIADKVAQQIKKLYPDLLEQNNLDFNTIYLINTMSVNTVHAASAARSAAQSYSSGGGGFSSGGGGGSSFGGGGFSGGGSR